MTVKIVSIGNSKGIRIPKAMLQQLHLGKKADLRLEKNQLVLRPLNKKPREGWRKQLVKLKPGDFALTAEDKVWLAMKTASLLTN
jgi:antitoxin MazE